MGSVISENAILRARRKMSEQAVGSKQEDITLSRPLYQLLPQAPALTSLSDGVRPDSCNMK